MYGTKSFPQKTFPNEMNLHVLTAQQEKTRQEKQNKRGWRESKKKRPQNSAFCPACPNFGSYYFALGIEAHEMLNLQMALGNFLALNSQTVT